MLLWAAKTTAVKTSLTFNKKHHLQDLDTPLLYGSETWVLTKREENQLLVFERKVLRTISGPIVENGVYRRRYKFELDREFDNSTVINVVKTSRLRYAGHMVRRPGDLPQKASEAARNEAPRKT
jgi:hypothetical protein